MKPDQDADPLQRFVRDTEGVAPSEAARQRMWRGIQRQLAPRRRRPWWLIPLLLGAPAFAAASLAVYNHLRKESPPRVSPPPTRRPAPRLSKGRPPAAVSTPAASATEPAAANAPQRLRPSRPSARRVTRRRRPKAQGQRPKTNPAWPAPATPALPVAPLVEPKPPPAKPVTRSVLAQQMAAYDQALRLSQTDDRKAVMLWRRWRRRWPYGALAHEVHLNLIQSLLRLSDGDEARLEITHFLRRFPESPKRGSLEKLLRSKAGSQDASP